MKTVKIAILRAFFNFKLSHRLLLSHLICIYFAHEPRGVTERCETAVEELTLVTNLHPLNIFV